MPAPTPFVVSPFNPGDHDLRPSMTRLPNGAIVVVYEHNNGGSDAVAVRVLQADGTPITSETLIDIGNADYYPTVVAIDSSRFAIVTADFADANTSVEMKGSVFTISGPTLFQGPVVPISDPGTVNTDNGNGIRSSSSPMASSSRSGRSSRQALRSSPRAPSTPISTRSALKRGSANSTTPAPATRWCR